MNFENCPNCDKSLNGFFSADLLLESKVNFINKHLKQDKKAYCSSCSKSLLSKIANSFRKQKTDIEERLRQIRHYIPVITSPSPVNWDYEILGMVSAQTTSGTGFAMELSRWFVDFFGSGSNATNRKIETATSLCKADLRVQCAKQGGNVVISTDIDF